MLRNIVFDLGNVLLSFNPAEFLEANNYDVKLRKLIMSDIFNSPEWQLLDLGSITISEAIGSIASRSSLTRDEIAGIFDLRIRILYPIAQNIKMLPELNKHGFKLYYLSNFPADIFDEVKNSYDFFKFFEGGIISAEEKVSKPDPAIYRMLLEKYSLTAPECLYIDDLYKNVIASETAGMVGFHSEGSHDISSEVYRLLNI